jgi:hypothetical protein
MQFIANTTDTDEGDLLRLTSEVQTLVRGASPSILKKLGTQRLNDLKQFITQEQVALAKVAADVKSAINSSLTINELMGLGMDRLRELGAKAGVKVGPVDSWTNYNLNAIIDETLGEDDRHRTQERRADEFAGYSLNDPIGKLDER